MAAALAAGGLARPLDSGTTSPPNSATSHCTGRTNAVSLQPQRCDFGHGIARGELGEQLPAAARASRAPTTWRVRDDVQALLAGRLPSCVSDSRRDAVLRGEALARLRQRAVGRERRADRRADDLLVEIGLPIGEPLDDHREPARRAERARRSPCSSRAAASFALDERRQLGERLARASSPESPRSRSRTADQPAWGISSACGDDRARRGERARVDAGLAAPSNAAFAPAPQVAAAAAGSRAARAFCDVRLGARAWPSRARGR